MIDKFFICLKRSVILCCSSFFAWQVTRKFKKFKSCNLFDYRRYIQDIDLPKKYVNFSLVIYGIRRVLVKKLKIGFFGTEIEHGVYFGKYVNINYSKLINKVVTFNKERLSLLTTENRDCKVLALGPYIHYADLLFCDSEMKNLKQQLGKTLLVFPVHSIPNIIADFDLDEFILKINQIKHNGIYNSVIICLYYQDIIRGADAAYLAQKFKVVSAGHRFDPYFLDRLKTIIELSDDVVTNGIGTHVGYSNYLSKPLIAIEQAINYEGLFVERKSSGNGSLHDKWEIEYIKLNQLFYSLFVKNDFVITAEQQDFCKYYWGYDYIDGLRDKVNS